MWKQPGSIVEIFFFAVKKPVDKYKELVSYLKEKKDTIHPVTAELYIA